MEATKAAEAVVAAGVRAKTGRVGAVLAAAALALAACDPGIVAVVHRGEGGGVARTALHVRAVVDPADSALGDSLGWSEGVPGVEVHVLRIGTGDWIVEETDATGSVVFDDALPGRYRVWGGRTLTAEEAQVVGGVVRAFGDGRTIDVSGETTLELLLYADRPGSLVFGEVSSGTPPPSELGDAHGFVTMYLEIYNNSSTTEYLDGMILGHTYYVFSEILNLPCSATQYVRDDADVLHAVEMLQFPGSGAEYAIGPGETRVIAMVAIDHSAVWPSGSDLSGAAFEVGGYGYADNPAVPNMIDVGTRSYIPAAFVGPPYLTTHVTFLARPLDVASLPVASRDPRGFYSLAIPKDSLLDVVASDVVWPDLEIEHPPCIPMLHRDYNRYEGGFEDISFGSDEMFDALYSLQRWVLRYAEDGRAILANTHTTAVDMTWQLKTPEGLPPAP